MRVLYFTQDYTPHDHRFLSALAGSGHQVVYLRLERGARQMEDRPLPAQVTQMAWAGGQAPFRWQDSLRLRGALRGVLAEVKPDLVHAGPIQKAAWLAALAGVRPLVSMSWGSDLLLEADGNAFTRWNTRFTLRRSAVLVGDCEAVRQKAIAYGMPAERVVIFPWGVDLAQFSPAPPGPQGWRARRGWQDAFVLLCTRTWETVYGVDTLAKGFTLAAQQQPNLRLVMLGGGSQAGDLQRIFRQAEVQEWVTFPGQVSQRDLPAYYRQADLYVSASLSDGSSVSLMEALACGCPVLLSDIPANREWVMEGQEGWFFPPGDEHALAQAILRATAARPELAGMGQAARRRAEGRADWTMNFRQLLRAYDMALAGRKR
jgi:glycosyltransferase involved in cell wall biosynthesis